MPSDSTLQSIAEVSADVERAEIVLVPGLLTVLEKSVSVLQLVPRSP